MAIIKCEECGAKYSDKAPGCPHCAKTEKQSTGVDPFRVGALLLLIFVVFFFVIASPRDKSSNESASKQKSLLTESMAYTMSQQFVKDQLKAPATADFPWMDEATIRKTGPGEFLVLSYVDAKNSFGAQIRNHYACKLKSDDNGKTWNLVEFSFANQ